MAKVTVYSKENCSECITVKNFLTNNGVEFEEIDIEKNPEARDFVQSLGFSSLPVTTVEGQQPFSRFNIDRLYDLV